MATTATAASAAANPAVSTPTAARPQLKSSMSSSGPGGNPNRRSTQSPIDGPQRRNSSKQQAWQVNVATQKYNGTGVPTATSPTPSQAASMKTRTPSLAQGTESDSHDKHMHDRQLYLLTHLVSRTVTVTVKSGAQYAGILSGVDTKSHDLGVSLKFAKLVKAGLGDMEEKGKDGGLAEAVCEQTIVFEAKDVVELAADDIKLGDSEVIGAPQTNGATGGAFKTDADISGNLAVRERELHKWQPEDHPDDGLSLENSSGRGWDQFAENERLFGLKTDYDENIYTTKLDRSHPLYQQREAAAARMAAEIEGGTYSSAHVAEERGITVDDSGLDEEDKYSGVQRGNPSLASNNPNRYTPPALRAPTGHPTVLGAPHDPAIISSQLARPETLQQKQRQQPGPSEQPPVVAKPSEDVNGKPKDRLALPQQIPTVRTVLAPPSGPVKQEQIEKEVSQTFKNFVNSEKERVKKRKQDMAIRDRESKLKELKKFAENFTLKSVVPEDLVPILAKDKAKQQEIKEKALQNLAKPAGGSTPMPSVPSTNAHTVTAGLQAKFGQKQLPKDSFAAKNPDKFARDTQALLSSLPPKLRNTTTQNTLSANLQRFQSDKNFMAKPPQVIPERSFPPTGPAASTAPPTSGSNTSAGPTRFNVKAKPFEFKPNANAMAFVPNFNGPSSNASPSPTMPAHVHGASRVASPSPFFGGKKLKPLSERPSVKRHFNPFMRMKSTASTQVESPTKKKVKGPGNDWVIPPWHTTPVWLTPEEEGKKEKGNLEKKSYGELFGQPSAIAPNMNSPQPPHMMPPQPHHQQLPAHMPPMNQPHHMPHQPPHGHMQPHLGLPQHYEQDHMRSNPSSVMPSPSMHPANTVPPYAQQSPVPHPSQPAMYQGGQGAVAPAYGVAVAPQFGYYGGGFRGGAGAPHMMVPGAPQPVPFPGGQMGGQYMHPQMYGSPQQPHNYMNNGPPPPAPQGYHSPRAAPMMMHQGSSQGTPGQTHMVPYGMQPGQGGPMYVPQGQQQQQQSELFLQGQPWLPQRPQSTVPVSSAVTSPHLRHKQMVTQQPPGGSPLLTPELAAFASSPPLAPVHGFTSHPLQRSQTSNAAQGAGGEGGSSRGGGRGSKGGRNYAGGGNGRMPGGGRGGNMQMGQMPASPQHMHASLMDPGSNNPMIVGMMRGQPLPHQGGPPPQFYHGPPQGHFPPGAGRGYNGPGGPQSHPGGPQGPPPQMQPPQQQPPPQQPQQQQANTDGGEDGGK